MNEQSIEFLSDTNKKNNAFKVNTQLFKSAP